MIILTNYIIKENDTFDGIATLFNTSIELLLELNPFLRYYFQPNTIIQAPVTILRSETPNTLAPECEYDGVKYGNGTEIYRNGQCLRCISGAWRNCT